MNKNSQFLTDYNLKDGDPIICLIDNTFIEDALIRYHDGLLFVEQSSCNGDNIRNYEGSTLIYKYTWIFTYYGNGICNASVIIIDSKEDFLKKEYVKDRFKSRFSISFCYLLFNYKFKEISTVFNLTSLTYFTSNENYILITEQNNIKTTFSNTNKAYLAIDLLNKYDNGH